MGYRYICKVCKKDNCNNGLWKIQAIKAFNDLYGKSINTANIHLCQDCYFKGISQCDKCKTYNTNNSHTCSKCGEIL